MTTLTEDDRRALENCELTGGLGPEGLNALAEIAEIVPLNPGARIFDRNDPAASIYVVISGRVALTLPINIRGDEREVTVEEKKRGKVVGWSGLVDPNRRTLAAKAITESRLLALPRSSLEALFEKQPDVYLRIFVNLARVIGDRVSMLETALLEDLQQWVKATFS